MFIHGGFWKSLDAATFSFVGGAFAPAGALVAVIDYPLIPDVRMGKIVDHVGQAIRWLSGNARAHGAIRSGSMSRDIPRAASSRPSRSILPGKQRTAYRPGRCTAGSPFPASSSSNPCGDHSSRKACR